MGPDCSVMHENDGYKEPGISTGVPGRVERSGRARRRPAERLAKATAKAPSDVSIRRMAARGAAGAAPHPQPDAGGGCVPPPPPAPPSGAAQTDGAQILSPA